MALVLAIEPDSVQADALRHLLRTRADTDVVVVGSTDAAVAAVDERVPDLVLVGALLSPRDEDPFIAHLRTLPDAGHLQTLTIPHLRQASCDPRRGLAIFGRRKRRQEDKAAVGCDPTQFGAEVAAYLARACEVKAEIEQRKTAAADGDPPVADRTEPAGTRSSVSAEGPSPQDIDRFTDLGPGREFAPDECEDVRHRVATPREACTAGQAETATTHAAELDQVRAEANRTLADELTAAEERYLGDIARFQTEAAEKSAAATQDAQARAEAQADETLAAEQNRARADAELTTLAAQLAAAEERHRAELARLETEAAESRDDATRDAQARTEAQADETLAAELIRVRADAERTLADELAAAEERHRAQVTQLETEAANNRDDATRDAQARADAQADETLAAERNRARAETELMSLAARLATAEERHCAEIARLETEAAESRDAATGDAQARTEAQADDRLTAELDRVRAEAERTLAAELAAAEERHRAEIARLETEAAESRDAATRDARFAGDRDPLLAAAPSSSISRRRSVEPIHRDEEAVGPSAATDYYNLWRARFAAADVPRVEAGVARPRRVDPRRRRWALSIAATLLILLTNNSASGVAPRQTLATVEAASASHAIGPARSLDRDDTVRAPNSGDMALHDPRNPATGDNPETGASSPPPLSKLVLEIMCVLALMLLLRVMLFVGEGLVWHGLVVTLGLILLGFVVMRAPWGG